MIETCNSKTGHCLNSDWYRNHNHWYRNHNPLNSAEILGPNKKVAR